VTRAWRQILIEASNPNPNPTNPGFGSDCFC
jgi:hypothetical protein